ncbi:hypothetical protein GOODEAATRI_011744, partial [Goodea atripinnis]
LLIALQKPPSSASSADQTSAQLPSQHGLMLKRWELKPPVKTPTGRPGILSLSQFWDRLCVRLSEPAAVRVSMQLGGERRRRNAAAALPATSCFGQRLAG